MTAREVLAAKGPVLLAQFGEDVWHLPGGVLADRAKTTAIVDWGEELGSNEVRGDGISGLNQDRGRSIRRTLKIDVAVGFDVEEDGKDKFQVTNPTTEELELWSVKRTVGRDGGLRSLLLVRQIEHQAQPGRRMG